MKKSNTYYPPKTFIGRWWNRLLGRKEWYVSEGPGIAIMNCRAVNRWEK